MADVVAAGAGLAWHRAYSPLVPDLAVAAPKLCGEVVVAEKDDMTLTSPVLERAEEGTALPFGRPTQNKLIGHATAVWRGRTTERSSKGRWAVMSLAREGADRDWKAESTQKSTWSRKNPVSAALAVPAREVESTGSKSGSVNWRRKWKRGDRGC
jgi:hypothetical protein